MEAFFAVVLLWFVGAVLVVRRERNWPEVAPLDRQAKALAERASREGVEWLGRPPTGLLPRLQNVPRLFSREDARAMNFLQREFADETVWIFEVVHLERRKRRQVAHWETLVVASRKGGGAYPNFAAVPRSRKRFGRSNGSEEPDGLSDFERALAALPRWGWHGAGDLVVARTSGRLGDRPLEPLLIAMCGVLEALEATPPGSITGHNGGR